MNQKLIYNIYLLILIVEINAENRNQIYITDTPLVQIGSRFYKKELITNEYDSPKELAYDSISKNLYFMYMDDELQNSGRALVNVLTKESLKIKGISKNKATAVNSANGDVYFGSENGLYKYDFYTNKAINVGLWNVNILQLVIRNNQIYLIDANNHMIYTVVGEGVMAKKLGNWKTVMEFNVDDKNNVHFVTMCGVYCAINGGETVKNNNLTVVYHFAVDGNQMYGMTLDSIYKMDCENGIANKVADIDFFPRSIVFGDNGYIFYAIDNNIYSLRPVNSYHVYTVNRS